MEGYTKAVEVFEEIYGFTSADRLRLRNSEAGLHYSYKRLGDTPTTSGKNKIKHYHIYVSKDLQAKSIGALIRIADEGELLTVHAQQLHLSLELDCITEI